MITIRNEQPKDYRQVEEITRKAFWNLYFPGASEHYLVHTMRGHKDYMPELSFVIEENGEIIGSIHFTHAKVITPGGGEISVVSFGPVSIKPERHRQGFGRALITHAIESSKTHGHRAIVLGGFPYHYKPYGFVGTKKYDIAMTDGKFYTGVMALPLYDGALDGVSGKIKFSDGLYPDENGLEAYEATFPPMKKLSLPHQKAFEQAASELDEQECK
ncbi:GNAT family N-acetyltransferase [Peribacillus frigoritolerans]|uniref:GNAT family N-acetyltransferase n=1 Tax=Peribacillus frigoritolerans TaxID=450367 RepID=UPI0020BEA931|nr:N-acetyltransferase [Peribacillus frigoritolerans]MEE3952647.1 N-acetyltransferase [Peribacillus frigoritolerans]